MGSELPPYDLWSVDSILAKILVLFSVGIEIKGKRVRCAASTLTRSKQKSLLWLWTAVNCIHSSSIPSTRYMPTEAVSTRMFHNVLIS